MIRLVRELMTREEMGGSLQNQHFPIMVVEGSRGTGKTALLSELAGLLDQRVPYARLDFEAHQHASVPEMLSALAFELSRKCPRYGALRFPRFIVGQHVIGLDLDLTNRTQARRQVVAALERHRGVDTFREMLLKAARPVLDNMGKSTGLPVEQTGRYAFGFWLTWLTWLTRHLPGRIVLGSFQDWYGHQDLRRTNDSVDVLVDLNWAKNRGDDQRRIDDLLWAAFLADLRVEFDRGRRAGERSLNCVVLLDNADTALGRRFLDDLVRTRRHRAAGGPADADPLTVVVTSRGALLADVSSTDVAPATTNDTRSGQLADTTDRWGLGWLQYRLPDLTKDEVGTAVAALDLRQGNVQRVTRVIYHLTGGHPGATSLALKAITKKPPKELIYPEEILGQVFSSQGPTVEDQILDNLLAGVSPEARPDLATCAAAREQRHALALAVQNDLLVGDQVNYVETLDPVLWPTPAAAGSALLRRLLRRCLARRDFPNSPSWPAVYGRLREACRADGDEAGELYYALAGGDLAFVTRRLHQRFAELADTPWFTLVESVTSAPYRRQRQDGDKALTDEVRTLVCAADLEQPLTSLGRLVAALWVAADPFSHSGRSKLHDQIANDCTEVARLGPTGPSAVLLEASRRHRREAERWD